MDVFIGSKVTEIVLTVSTTCKVTKIVGPALRAKSPKLLDAFDF